MISIPQPCAKPGSDFLLLATVAVLTVLDKNGNWNSGLRVRKVSKQNGIFYDRLQLIKKYHWFLFLISIPQPCGKPVSHFVWVATVAVLLDKMETGIQHYGAGK